MKQEVEINLTPEQLAELFIRWRNDEQGEFINLIGKHFKASNFNSEGQVCSIAEEIKKDGKDFVYTLANFIKAQKFSSQSKHFDMLINYYPCDGLY